MIMEYILLCVIYDVKFDTPETALNAKKAFKF